MKSTKLKFFLLLSLPFSFIFSQSLDLPSKNWGLSIGNSEYFNGVRINFSDYYVEEINGLNITFWRSDENKHSTYNGLSLGVWGPQGGSFNGIQLGGLGVAAEDELNGFSFALLGAGAGNKISGITFGGLGVGAGGSVTGINFGGLGVGSGGNLTGINIGGLGVGAGGNMTGINFGLLGVGAGGDVTGVSIGGIGAGCGGTMTGLVIGGVGAGAPRIEGVALGGVGVGGTDITGAALAIGMVRLENGGDLTGFALSGVNYIKGYQTGLSIGLFNYAQHLTGVQLGILNFIEDNPVLLKVMPLINFSW